MGIIAALIMALLISLLFSTGYRKGGSFWPILVFFIVLFMAILAAQYWITPFGPMMWGIAWVPLLFVGVICAFLLITPSPGTTVSAAEKSDATTSAVAAISIFIWLLLLLLLIAIITGYYKTPVLIGGRV